VIDRVGDSERTDIGRMKKVLLIGAGGHGRVVLELLRLNEGMEIGICEKADFGKKEVDGFPVVGSDGDLGGLFEEGYKEAVIGVGSVGETGPRRRIAENLAEIGYKFCVYIHPGAVVSESAKIGCGSVVFAGAVVNAHAVIGEHCIVNSGAIIEHDCRVEDFAHVAPGAVLGGNVIVKQDAHIGIGAVIKEGITIGEGSVIGAGSVVVSGVEDNVVVVGVPAKRIRDKDRS
jgi:UDP-perosamine 4-acetyltransferase